MAVPPKLAARLKKVRLFAMDVDGVLTDGSIIVLESGEEVKAWHVRDRIGFFMLRESGAHFHTAWITGRKSNAVKGAAENLRIGALYQKCEDKGAALREVTRKFGLIPEEVLFIGDDLVDLPAFKAAGLAICPADAPDVVRKACRWTTKAAGGKGVFREVADAVLQAQGLWPRVIGRFEKSV